jgi:hypothetical protein
VPPRENENRAVAGLSSYGPGWIRTTDRRIMSGAGRPQVASSCLRQATVGSVRPGYICQLGDTVRDTFRAGTDPSCPTLGLASCRCSRAGVDPSHQRAGQRRSGPWRGDRAVRDSARCRAGGRCGVAQAVAPRSTRSHHELHGEQVLALYPLNVGEVERRYPSVATCVRLKRRRAFPADLDQAWAGVAAGAWASSRPGVQWVAKYQPSPRTGYRSPWLSG